MLLEFLNCHSSVTERVIVMQRPVVRPFLRPFSLNTFAQTRQSAHVESSSNTWPRRYTNSRCTIPSSSKTVTNITLMLDFVARDFLGSGDELGQKQHSDCATPAQFPRPRTKWLLALLYAENGPSRMSFRNGGRHKGKCRRVTARDQMKWRNNDRNSVNVTWELQ
jgi:hypothetical protein